MAIIQVSAPGGDYPIHIELGLLQQIAGYIPDARCVIVTNTTIAPLYGSALAERLPEARLVTIPDGEQHKTLVTVAQLYSDFVKAGLDRSGTVVALGGGVVGDTVGFAAATYMRGVRFIQIPTTLLAMVDSSVGGKVGVDLPEGKNLVGAFKQPDKVLIDPKVLSTLPAREWRCGMAETLKHGLLADPGLLELAEQPDAAADELVHRAVQVKVTIVQQDPYEKSIRAHLNLGHTFAHAIEQVSGYTWPHGEAVAVGLLAAAHLSARLGRCDAGLTDAVEQMVVRVGLPTRIGALDPDALYAAMSTDKKWLAGQSRFILLRGIGQPEIVEGIDKSDILAVLRELE
jgi:3-dehydroquinate synthase